MVNKVDKPYTLERRIERISRWQFREFLEWNWWVVEGDDPDFGEDELVSIYDEGEWSGIRFLVQIKGTQRDIGELIVYGNQLSWSVEAKNLRRWDQSSNPVIFVIWNIDTRTGYWVYVRNEIERLDKANIQWRNGNQGSVTLHVPYENVLDADALKVLRALLANFWLPIYQRDQNPLQKTVTFSFDPETEEGKHLDKAVSDLFDHGGMVKVDSKYIKAITYSKWYERLFGIDQPTRILSGETTLQSHADSAPFPFRIEVHNNNEPIFQFETVFRVTDGGLKTYTLSNKDHYFPLTLALRLPRKGIKSNPLLSYHIKDMGMDVLQSRELLQLLKALEDGTKLVFLTLSDNMKDFELDIPYHHVDFRIPPEYHRLVEQLCQVQRKFGKRISLREIELTEEITREAVEFIDLMSKGYLDIATHLMKVEFDKAHILEMAEHMRQMEAMTLAFRKKHVTYRVINQYIEIAGIEGEIVAISLDSPDTITEIAERLNTNERASIFVRVLSGYIKPL